jgi:hypothetical protein
MSQFRPSGACQLSKSLPVYGQIWTVRKMGRAGTIARYVEEEKGRGEQGPHFLKERQGTVANLTPDYFDPDVTHWPSASFVDIAHGFPWARVIEEFVNSPSTLLKKLMILFRIWTR